MRRFTLFLLPLMATAQTMIRVDQTIFLPAPSEPSIVMYRAGQPPLTVVLGPGLTLDLSGPVAMLKAAPSTVSAPAPIKPWVVDVIVMTSDSTGPFLASRIPATPPMVTRNGLVMSPVVDYLVNGQSMTFLAAQRPMKGDMLQFRYREQ